jgi:hypothetical protein
LIVVFAGPSLQAEDWQLLPDASYLPPAACGDIYKAAQGGPSVIGIIDGFFDGVPSIWHKEILWALSEGIHVVGAASMGALRAAELSAFGMIGIGQIFKQYRDGEIEDDDEVAVLHGDAASGYSILGQAMVDLRRIFSDCNRAGVICLTTAATLTRIAKQLHFRERNLFNVCALASDIVHSTEIDALLEWSRSYNISQKREDAIEMLTFIASNRHTYEHPFRPTFDFQYTAHWHEFRREFGNIHSSRGNDSSDAVTTDDILDELRLHFGGYGEMLTDTLLLYLALREFDRHDFALDDAVISRTVERFRRRNGLQTARQFNEWRYSSALDAERDILKFFRDRSRLYSIVDRFEINAHQYLIDWLRDRGIYSSVLARAREKQSVLLNGLTSRKSSEVQAHMDKALDWYVESGTRALSQERSLLYSKLGYPDETSFLIALCKEYDFARAGNPP